MIQQVKYNTSILKFLALKCAFFHEYQLFSYLKLVIYLYQKKTDVKQLQLHLALKI